MTTATQARRVSSGRGRGDESSPEVFLNVKLPVWTTEDSDQGGFAVISGNDFGGQQPAITQTGTFTTASVAAQVEAGAGIGKI